MRFRLVPKSKTLGDLELRIQRLPEVFKYTLLSQERVKLRPSKYSQGPSEQKAIKILEKSERGRIQELPKFLKYPILSQERVKLWISNLAGAFTGPIRRKARLKFWRKSKYVSK